ncbi:MAG: hypothetical protein ISS79_10725 [Phycisphaerae bacterium]|nr:hypothetical protein [Phycisphaerae bacterium]
MLKAKFCKSDPDMLPVLDELDYLIASMRRIIGSLESGSECSVGLNDVVERTERLRTRIACMSNNDVDWVSILQAIVCIAQYLTKLSM